MNRRNFLKILASAVVAPVALPGIDILIPAGPVPQSAVIKKARQGGITATVVIYDEFASSNDVLYFKNIPLYYRKYLP